MAEHDYYIHICLFIQHKTTLIHTPVKLAWHAEVALFNAAAAMALPLQLHTRTAALDRVMDRHVTPHMALILTAPPVLCKVRTLKGAVVDREGWMLLNRRRDAIRSRPCVISMT